MDSSAAGNDTDYNEILSQISVSLNNALNTYGASSSQYQTILSILKDCLQKYGCDGRQTRDLDPDTLSLAMGFLEIGK